MDPAVSGCYPGWNREQRCAVISYETLRAFDDRTRHILTLLETLISKVDAMSQELDAVVAKVNELKTVEESAIVLLGNLSNMIRDLKDDPAELLKLADDLDTQKSRLADAVAANTPIGKKK
jgi:DNA repair ATPase RecN